MKFGLRLFLLLAATATPALAEDWHIGPFTITWLDGFKQLPAGSNLQYANADGITVIVDNFVHKPTDEKGEAEAVQNWTHFGETALPNLATRQGSIARPLVKETMPDGSLLYSMAADGDPSDPQFGLFFLDISKKGDIAQFSVEGSGLQKDYWDRYRPLFNSAKWSD